MIIFIGVTIFIVTTVSFELDVIIIYDAYFSENRIVINDIITISTDYIYAYKSLNDKVYIYTITDIEYFDNQTIFYLSETDLNEHGTLLGNIKVDIANGKQTLFELIFIKAGKKDVE